MTALPGSDSPEWQREHACTGKRAMNAREARRIAESKRREGSPTVPYLCPFHAEHDDPARSWHVGHAMGMTGLEAQAAMLRARTGNAPKPAGRKESRRRAKRHHRKDDP